MIGFWIAVAFLIGIALWMLARPLLAQRPAAAPLRNEMNIAVYRDHLRDLDGELESGSLTPEQHDKARRELDAGCWKTSRAAMARRGPRGPRASRQSRSGQGFLWARSRSIFLSAPRRRSIRGRLRRTPQPLQWIASSSKPWSRVLRRD